MSQEIRPDDPRYIAAQLLDGMERSGYKHPMIKRKRHNHVTVYLSDVGCGTYFCGQGDCINEVNHIFRYYEMKRILEMYSGEIEND